MKKNLHAKYFFISIVFVIYLTCGGLAAAQSAKSFYDDARIVKWSSDFRSGKRPAVLAEVEKDLVSGKPHPLSAQIWCFLLDESDELAEKWKQLNDQKLRRALGEMPEVYLLYRAGEYRKMLEKYPAANAVSVKNPAALNLLIKAAAEETDWNSELIYAKAAIDLDANSFAAVWEISNDLTKNAAARAEFEKLVNSGGKWNGTLAAGFLKKALDAPEESIGDEAFLPAIDEWLGKHKTDRNMMFLKGIVLQNLGRYADAAEMYRQGFEVFPFVTDGLVRRYLETLVKLERTDEARKFTKNYALWVDEGVSAKRFEYYLMARVFYNTDSMNEGLKVIAEAEKENLLDARLLIQKARLRKKEEFAEALNYVNEAIKAEPENRLWYEEFIEMASGKNGAEPSGYEKFIEYEQKFTQKSADSFFNASRMLQKLGRQDERIKLCQKAIETFRGSAMMYRELAEAQTKTGQNAAALESLAKSFELQGFTDRSLTAYFDLIEKPRILSELENLKRKYPWIDKTRNFTRKTAPKITEIEQPTINTLNLVTQLGHGEAINFITVSPDKRLTATAGKDNKFCIWQTETGLQLRCFERSSSEESVNTLQFSPDNLHIASGGKNGIYIQEVASGKNVSEIFNIETEEEVLSLDYSPDGKYILFGERNPNIRLWDIKSKKIVKIYETKAAPNFIKFSADGSLILAIIENEISLWDTEKSQLTKSYTCGESNKIVATDISDDNKFVLAVCRNKSVILFDAGTGVQISSFDKLGEITTAIFLPGGKELILGEKKGELIKFDLEQFKETKRYKGFGVELKTIAEVSTENNIIVQDMKGNFFLADMESGKKISSFSGLGANISAISIIKPKDMAVTGNKNSEIHIWDLKTGSQIAVLEGHRESVTRLVYSERTNLLASGSDDGTIRFWNIDERKKIGNALEQGGKIKEIEFSADGRFLYSIDGSNNLSLWNVAEQKRIAQFGANDRIENIADFSPDSRYFINVNEEFKAVRFNDVATGQPSANKRDLGNNISVAAYSPTENIIAAGSVDGVLSVWNADTGSLVFSKELGSVIIGVTFSIDGKTVLITSAENRALVINLADKNSIMELGAKSIGNDFAAASPNANFFLTANDNSFFLWNKAGEEIAAYSKTRFVNPITAFSADGKRLLLGGNDSLTKVIFLNDFENTKSNFKAGDEICRFISFADKTWAVVDSEKRYDASNEGVVGGLHYAVGTETVSLEQLKIRYYEPELLAKALGYNKQPLKNVGQVDSVKLNPQVSTEFLDAERLKLKITLKNRGGGIGRVQIFLNNKEIFADARNDEQKRETKRETAELIVDLTDKKQYLSNAVDKEGKKFENIVRVVAWNEDDWLSSRSGVYRVNSDAQLNPPRLYAIIGGVSDYAGSEIDLTFAGKDATDMAQAIESGARRMLCVGIPIDSPECSERINITLLTDFKNDYSKAKNAQLPTKENFKKAFEAARTAAADDIFIVYLSGHGITLENKSDVYAYLTSDAFTGNPNAFKDEVLLNRQTITSVELTDWIKQVPALKQVMILDTCAAGGAAEKLKFVEQKNLSGDQIRAIARLKDTTGFYVLMGSAANAVSYEASTYGQGLLTYSLLSGIGTRSNEVFEIDDAVNVSKLFDYSTAKVPELARNIGGIQKPKMITPVNSQPFPIGIFTSAERNMIKLPPPKKMFLRPRMTNLDPNILDDNLLLEKAVSNFLVNDIFTKSRNGEEVEVLFLNSDDDPNSYRIVGAYTVTGEKISVKIRIRQDNKTLPKETVVEGTTEDKTDLAKKIVEAAKKMIIEGK